MLQLRYDAGKVFRGASRLRAFSRTFAQVTKGEAFRGDLRLPEVGSNPARWMLVLAPGEPEAGLSALEVGLSLLEVGVVAVFLRPSTSIKPIN